MTSELFAQMVSSIWLKEERVAVNIGRDKKGAKDPARAG